jgi:hypothetical protein
MIHSSPLLACGSMGITKTQGILILISLALWLVGALLAIVNLVLICLLHRRAWKHIALFLFYFAWGITIVCNWAPAPPASTPQSVLFIFVTMPPLVAIGHFVFLLITRRKRKGERKSENLTVTPS